MIHTTIKEIQKNILPVDEKSMQAAREHWMAIAKPLFSLGKLEETVIRIAGMKRSPEYELGKKGLVIMCADNGVVAEGVTQTGQEVTVVVADNFTKGKASTCLMAEVAGVDLFPVDIGMAVDVPSVTVPEYKIAYGTGNIAKEPAMTREAAWLAIEVGISIARELKMKGYGILLTGEMGIGNTTTSSALASVFLGEPVETMTGRGAGLSSEGLERKTGAIRRAISLHQPNPSDPLDVLAKVGGLDIAGLCGVFLGGALEGIPVVVDGFISAVAALTAVRMVPAVSEYLLPSHISKEPAGQMLLEELGLSAMIDAQMSLGEGSGAVAMIPLLEMGLQVYRRMPTFEQAEIEQYEVLK